MTPRLGSVVIFCSVLGGGLGVYGYQRSLPSVRQTEGGLPTVSSLQESPRAADTQAHPAPIPAQQLSATLPGPVEKAFEPEAPAAPQTKQELARLEYRCDQRQAAACEAAAWGYEQGNLVPKSAARAKTFRSIALNFYVQGCNRTDASACLALSRWFKAGFVVEQNVKKAEMLRERAAHLCQTRAQEGCPEALLKRTE